jgi:hypothetical protein
MVFSGAGGRTDGREVEAGGPLRPCAFALLFEFFLPISVTRPPLVIEPGVR